jgi:hypothetical protein
MKTKSTPPKLPLKWEGVNIPGIVPNKVLVLR